MTARPSPPPKRATAPVDPRKKTLLRLYVEQRLGANRPMLPIAPLPPPPGGKTKAAGA